MSDENFYRLLATRFQRGDAFIRSATGEDRFGYDDLETKSAAYAARFAGMGLAKGDRVIVQVEKSAECLFVYFACLRAGLVYLPLNTAYLRHEVEYFVGDAEPALVVCDPTRHALFEQIATCPILTLDADGNGSVSEGLAPAAFQTVACEAQDTAVILYTSGTTGQPKGAMITHGNLAANSQALYKAWGWTTGDVMLHALPIFHIHGLFVGTHLAIMNASPIILLPRFDPDEVIRLLPHATVYMGVPTNYTRLLAKPGLDKTACRHMRLFTSGSAPLLVQTFNEFSERTGHTIVERYGMTETGMNCSNPVDGRRKPGTVGPPLPGVEAKVVDSDGHQVATGETGDLRIRGDNVFKGYWRLPEKTALEFDADGYFKTGDQASMDAEGYVSIVGRSKDMIITGGLNVYPKEVELVIDQMDGVAESAVIGIPHADFGEAVTAVVVRSPGATITEQDVMDGLKSTLANFKVAKRVHFVDELPRNTMGKVQKSLLRQQFG